MIKNPLQIIFKHALSRVCVFLLFVSFVFQCLYLNQIALAAEGEVFTAENNSTDTTFRPENPAFVPENQATTEEKPATKTAENPNDTSIPNTSVDESVEAKKEKPPTAAPTKNKITENKDELLLTAEMSENKIPEPVNNSNDSSADYDIDIKIVDSTGSATIENDNILNEQTPKVPETNNASGSLPTEGTGSEPANTENLESSSSTELENYEENKDAVNGTSSDTSLEDKAGVEENDLVLEGSSESVSFVARTDSLNFNKDECVTVSDGSFYCNKKQEKYLDNTLFSAPDSDGDLEIFLAKDGKQIQITHNLTDDASPFFDHISNTIVWHRLINDRYQIVSYDLKNDTETILTQGSVNNMEPSRQGEYTVWQRWTGKSWNIILLKDGQETSLTNSESEHNLTPKIQGSLVIWNQHADSGEKKVGIYNLETKSLVLVDDPEGVSVDNPRVVLMYDSLYSNGDVITKGFDLISNKFIDFSNFPQRLPEIPKSESKEIKALTQTKLELETVLNDADLPNVPNSDGDKKGENDEKNTNLDKTATTTGTTTESFTLDLNQGATTTVEVEDFTLDLSQATKTDEKITAEEKSDFDLKISKFSVADELSVK